MPAKKNSKKTASKKKATPSKSTAKTASKSNSVTSSLFSNRAVIVCEIVLFWVLGLIVLFSLGSVGVFLKEAFELIMGSFLYLFIPAAMIYGFWYIWTLGQKKIPARIWAGILFASLFYMLCVGLVCTRADDPWSALQDIQNQLPNFPQGKFTSLCGYAGALLAGFLTSCFSKTGALIIDISLLALAIVLLGWSGLKLFILGSSSQAENRKTRLKEKARNYVESRKAEERIADNMSGTPDLGDGLSKIPTVEPAPAPSVFDNGQPLVDFDEDFARNEGFAIPDVDEVVPEKKTRKKRKAKTETPVADQEPETVPAQAEPTPDLSGAASSVDGERLHDLSNYHLPPLSLLDDPKAKGRNTTNLKNAKEMGQRLIDILREFNVEATLGEIHIGPTVTEFEIIPGAGVRVATFKNLQNDIKMALAAKDIRVEAPIPGKSAVGIEVPNLEKTPVTMKEVIRSVPNDMKDKPLVFALGKNLMGASVYGRLDTMPHLLIAGATGSGKSVCVNSIISSILLRTRPDEVKLLLIDPKKVEFTPYNGVPHLLAPVITDANLANGALKIIVEMMEARYSMFEDIPVRNISSYNEYVRRHPEANLQPMPRIVVIVDELADLMLAAGKEVEQSIQRITQLARAAGIHLIVATQRPSVNVITGVIKANIPARIAFMVSSATDSRTILDQNGAERLLGNGDMLFLDNGDSSPTRLQGVFIQDKEVEAITSYVKGQATPEYADPFILLKEVQSEGGEVPDFEDLDPLYEEVRNFVVVSRKASTSMVQRRFRIGYGRAARILDQLEANGIIGPSRGSRPREILVEDPGADPEGEY